MRASLRRAFGGAALAGLLGAAILIGLSGQGARAADDDEDDLPDVKILRHILKGLGLRRDEEGIDYRERPPLVLPANRDLPPPETDATGKTAGWPDDPDVKAARQRKIENRKRHAHVEGVDDRPLRPSEMSNAPPTTRDDGKPQKTVEETANPMSPSELGSKSFFNWNNLWGSSEEYSTFTREPPRTTLIEPPAGYRTPSPNQPYGVGKEKWTPNSNPDRHVYTR